MHSLWIRGIFSPTMLALMAPGAVLMLYLAANRRIAWWLPLFASPVAWWIGGKGYVLYQAHARLGARAAWRIFAHAGPPFAFTQAAMAVSVLGVALLAYCHLRERLSDSPRR